MNRIIMFILVGFIAAGMTGIWSPAASEQAKKGEKEGFLGVYLEDVDDDIRESAGFKGDGAFVQDVVDDTPADEAGIEAGDIIVEYAGKKVSGASDLRKQIQKTEPGEKVKIMVFREGKEKAMTVKIGKRSKYAEKTIKIISEPGRKIKVFRHTKEIVSVKCKSGAFLGVHLQDMTGQLMKYFKVEYGVLVSSVVEGSAAEKAGIKAGDVIMEFHKREVEDASDLSYLVSKRKPGEKVDIKVMRDGNANEFKVELGERKHECLSECTGDCMEFNLGNLDEMLEDIPMKIKKSLKNIEIEVQSQCAD